MDAKTMMSRPVVTLLPATTVIEALEVASARDIRHLPVVSHDKLVGFLCVCDLDDAKLDAPISSYMHSRVVTTNPEAALEDLVFDMDAAQVGSLIVVDGERVVGIVTRADLERVEAPLAIRSCSRCQATSHLKRRANDEHLCAGCTGHAGPAEDDDELGGSD